MTAQAPVAAQTPIPDFRGTWKGESESIILDGGNTHHPASQSNDPQLRSVSLTLTRLQASPPLPCCARLNCS